MEYSWRLSIIRLNWLMQAVFWTASYVDKSSAWRDG